MQNGTGLYMRSSNSELGLPVVWCTSLLAKTMDNFQS